MIQVIAEQIGRKRFTLPELASELNVGQDTLLERLFMMECLGFIVRSGGCVNSPCAEAPRYCSRCSGCRELWGQAITEYTLTEKGRQLARIKKLEDKIV